MKITPAEISQKTFKRNLTGGYDREEVNAFLKVLSQEWEKITDDAREARIKLELAEKEVKRLREIESALYKTLKTAEETSMHLLEDAHRTVDQQIRDAQNQAERITREAREKARFAVEEAEYQSKYILENTLSELKGMESDVNSISNEKENLLNEIKELIVGTLEKVSKADNNRNNKDFLEEKIKQLEANIGSRTLPQSFQNIEPATEKPKPTQQIGNPIILQDEHSGKSFFDEI